MLDLSVPFFVYLSYEQCCRFIIILIYFKRLHDFFYIALKI